MTKLLILLKITKIKVSDIKTKLAGFFKIMFICDHSKIDQIIADCLYCLRDLLTSSNNDILSQRDILAKVFVALEWAILGAEVIKKNSLKLKRASDSICYKNTKISGHPKDPRQGVFKPRHSKHTQPRVQKAYVGFDAIF